MKWISCTEPYCTADQFSGYKEKLPLDEAELSAHGVFPASTSESNYCSTDHTWRLSQDSIVTTKLSFIAPTYMTAHVVRKKYLVHSQYDWTDMMGKDRTMSLLTNSTYSSSSKSRIPENPEFFLLHCEVCMFPGPSVPSAVAQPHIIASICQHKAKAVVIQICDPIAGICKQTML